MLREAAQLYHQLPDLFIRQIVERRHRSSCRAVIDNPEQLSVGNFVNRLPAGKIARARIELARQLPAAIASLAVADDAGGIGKFFIEFPAGPELGRVHAKRVYPVIDRIGRLAGEARLWAFGRGLGDIGGSPDPFKGYEHLADDLMAVEQDGAAAEKLASPVTELALETRTTEPKNWLQRVNRLEISELGSGDF